MDSTIPLALIKEKRGFFNTDFPLTMNPLKHIPALAPPTGVTPNFVNPQSQASMMVVTSSICLILITILSLLRFYTNLWIKKSVKADDSKFFLLISEERKLRRVVVCAFAVVSLPHLAICPLWLTHLC